MLNKEIRELIDELENEYVHLAQVNEIWLERQRGPAESLRFRRFQYWTEWSELREMQNNWAKVSREDLRSWLVRCRIQLVGGLEEALTNWTDEERRQLEWLELDPAYERRIALVDSILQKLGTRIS